MGLRSKVLRIIDVTTTGLRRLSSRILEYNGETAALSRARDVTERKRMEEEIKSLARFPSENPNPLLRIDRNGILLTANEASKVLLQKWSFGVGQVAPKFWCEVATEALSTGVSKNLDVEVDAKFYSFFVKPNTEAGYVNLYGRDITERKQAEQALRESEGRFRAILDGVNDGILVADVENRKFYLGNKAICRMLGYRPKDIKNLGVMDIHPKESFPYVTEQFDRLARHEIGLATEIPVKRRDGSIFYADISPSFLTMAGRTYLVGVFRDITERKRVERTLRESEELYRHLIQRQGEGLAILDLEERFTFCNPRGDEIFGVSPGGMVGRTTQEFTTPETFEFIRKQTRKRLAGEKGTYELEIVRPDGDKRHLLVTAAPWLDKDGHVIGSVTIFRDETDRKRAEEEIRRLNQLRETIIDNANVWLDVLDEKANVVIWNKAAEVISGYSREEVVGHGKIWEWLYPDEEYRKQLIDQVAEVIKRGRVEEDFETRIRRKDGQIRIISWNERNLLDEHGKPIGSIAVGRDVTERKRMEEEIQRASQFVETILENANVSFNVLDENANVVIWNKAAELMTGYTREEVLRHAKIWEWLYPDEEYRRSITKKVADVMRRGRFDEDIETRILRKDGQVRIISWNQRNLVDKRGKVEGSVTIGRDITERKRMQEELERYSTHLEELVRERTEELRESEEKYRSLVENIPDIAWTTDRDGRTVFVSPNVVKVTGRTPEEIYAAGGTLWLERMHPDDKERVREAYEALFARNQPYDIEYRLQRKDGEWIWLHDRSVATYEKDGRRYADGLLSDITERKHMEQQVEEGMLKLRESEAKFRALYDSIADGIIYNDVPGRIFDCNRAFEKMVGYSLDELRKMKWQDITPKQYLELEEGIVREEMLKRGFSTYVEKEYIRKDGSRIQVETTASVIRGTGGKPDMIWCIVRDITERKRAEQQVEEGMLKLRESEAKFRGLYESIRDGIMANDVSGRIYDCNTAFQNMVGYSLDELRNMRYQDITPEQYRKLEDRITREEMVRGESSGYVEKEYIRKDGTKVPVEVAASLVKGTGGKPDMIWGVIRDITERKRAEEELRSARERLEHVIASNPAVIISGKPRADLSDYDVTYLSDRVVEMLGFEPQQFIGHSEFWNSHVHPDDLRGYSMEVPELWKKGQCTFEYRFLHKNGTYRWIREEAKVIRDAAGNPVEVMGYWTDVTEQKRMEEALVKSQRFATIGEVAAMVGHDLRNPLQVLTNALYLLEEGFKTQASSKKVELLEKNRPVLLETMEEQIGYMNKIVSDLQDYARPLKPELAPTNLRRLIDEVLSAAGLPISIDVSIEVEENVRELNIDHGLMKRAFTNFVTNAVQAMPDGGRLTIRALKADGIALIRIQDTGAGIPKENLDKVFTPMFSTKAKGQGFGLAACKRIVEAHNGKISLESAVGKGTTVFIKIPIVEVG